MYLNRLFTVRRGFFAGFALLAALVLASPAWAGKIVNYSADQIHMDPDGNVMTTGKVYVTPEKMRMDASGPPRGGGRMIVIVRRDLDVFRMLNPEKKAYLERPLDENDLEKFSKNFEPIEEVDLGTEEVSGYKCRKKRVTVVTEIMGFKRKNQSTVWVSDRFDMPLRTQGSDGSVSELRDIKEGKPDSRLFEVPDGYRQVASMMEMYEGPSEGGSPEATPDAGPGDDDDFRHRLPKGFKLPFGK